MYQTTLAVLALAGSVSAALYSSDPSHQKFLWENFKREHGRTYASAEEENIRFGHFLENLKTADRRQLAERRNGGSAQHGITKFTDWSQVRLLL